MSKFTFILEDDNEHSSKITMEFNNVVSLHSVIENFEDFLKGCGYQFDDTLDLVPKKDDPEVSTMDDNKTASSWTWTVGELQKFRTHYESNKLHIE